MTTQFSEEAIGNPKFVSKRLKISKTQAVSSTIMETDLVEKMNSLNLIKHITSKETIVAKIVFSQDFND